jgi:hypothetical protein
LLIGYELDEMAVVSISMLRCLSGSGRLVISE